MKLNHKILVANLILAVVIFLLTSVGMYFLVNATIYDELDNHLLQHKTDIVEQLQGDSSAVAEIQDLGVLGSYEWIELNPRQTNGTHSDAFTTVDTSRYKGGRNLESETYRQLTTSISVNDQPYTLKIYEEVAAWDRISMTILLSVLAGLLVWILLLYIVNQAVLKKILSPFYKTVHSLEEISDPSHLDGAFPQTSTYEINVLNSALNTMMGQIRSSFDDQKKFIQNASHELLTPLSIIRQKAEKMLSRSDQLERETVEAANEIQQTAVRLSRLSNALLLISRVENRQFNLDEQVQIEAVVDDILDELSDFIDLKYITVEKKFSSPITIEGNRELIHSAIYNIIQNAIKFSPEESAITIIANCNSDHCRLSVRDRGPGIPPEQINSIFDRFNKGQNHLHEFEKDDSPGLGLSIVDSICQLHGFQCFAENHKEGGAEITIRF